MIRSASSVPSTSTARLTVDAVAILGSIRSNGPIDGDAVSILGNISLGRDAHIGGNCVAVLGSVRHYNNNQIGRDLVQIPLALHLHPGALLFVCLIYVIRSLVWRARMPYPMPPPTSAAHAVIDSMFTTAL